MSRKLITTLDEKKLEKALKNIFKMRKEVIAYIKTTTPVAMDRVDYLNHRLQQACMELYRYLKVEG